MDRVAARAAGLFAVGGVTDEPESRAVLDAEGARDVVTALAEELEGGEPESADAWKAVVDRVKQRSGRRGRELFHPIRVAVSSSTAGPELDRLVPLIVDGSRRFPDRIPGLRARVRETAGSWA